MLDFSRFQVLTFDCYGTLIDWETGIFAALRPILAAHKKQLSDSELLEMYGELEAAAEGGDFRPYREVLKSVVRGLGQRLDFTPTEYEVRSLPESVAEWGPFSDTVAALRKLHARYKLAVISNIDDDLFVASARKLQVTFDSVTTARQARCYKPNVKIFNMALERIGVPREQVLHAGQSIYHDVIPAKSLGLATVWVNRPSPRPGSGAAKAAAGQPDLEVGNLATLAAKAAG